MKKPRITFSLYDRTDGPGPDDRRVEYDVLFDGRATGWVLVRTGNDVCEMITDLCGWAAEPDSHYLTEWDLRKAKAEARLFILRKWRKHGRHAPNSGTAWTAF